MPETSKQEIKLFYCYAREDKELRNELEKHLSALKRQYRLTNWSDREIQPGENWEHEIDHHLNTSDLILLLISPDFMASDYCYGKEMQHALERHKAGTCYVIPILLRPIYWEDVPFKSIQVLPTDAKPITRWSDRDEAFHDVVKNMSTAIKALFATRKSQEFLSEGDTFYKHKQYEDARIAYERVTRLDTNHIEAYKRLGKVLEELKYPLEALAAYKHAAYLAPNERV